MASIDDLFSCFNDQDDDRITSNPVVKTAPTTEETPSEPADTEYYITSTFNIT